MERIVLGPADPTHACDMVFEGESMTEQSHKKSCDINNIVKRYHRDGIPLTGYLDANAPFADVTHGFDYHSAYAAIRRLDEAFLLIPAEIRARFENDVQAFSEFISDPANEAEMEKMGLILPAEQETPSEAAGEQKEAPKGSEGVPAPNSPGEGSQSAGDANQEPPVGGGGT